MNFDLVAKLMPIDPINGRVQHFTLPQGKPWGTGVIVWCKGGKLALSSSPQTRPHNGGLLPGMPSLLEAGETQVYRWFHCPSPSVITVVVVEASEGFEALITKMGSRAECEA